MKREAIIILTSLIFFGCVEDPEKWKVDSIDLVITDYVASDPEFSEFSKILGTTGLDGLLSVRGPFTLFLPSNKEMEAYYQEKGVSSYTDFSEEFLETLVLNHLINSRLETADFALGAIRDQNALGDYLVTEFEGAEIKVNKESYIIKRNIPAANGVIHRIDKVIDPVTLSVYEKIANNPSYSLFTQGLEATGLSDTMNVIEFPYGDIMARTRYTVLAVADTTFNRYGILTIDDLISRYTNAPDSITFLENGFYRYMEYHCLDGTYYLNNLENKDYPVLSYDNLVSCNISDDYKLNLDNKTGEYIGFIIDQSNLPAKNGAVHTVDNLLPVKELDVLQEIVFETTDYFDLKQGAYYGKFYMRFFDGQNTFEYIKWEGDYLLYYYKNDPGFSLMNYDCLSMNGWWWIEITTPKIMKGEYILYSIQRGGTNYAVYVDGENTANILSSDPTGTTPWGRFKWTKTERHTIKLVAKSPGSLFWDTLIFTPQN
jgi:uncharacterized surface protein with fasciclin (FAS1) repeats